MLCCIVLCCSYLSHCVDILFLLHHNDPRCRGKSPLPDRIAFVRSVCGRLDTEALLMCRKLVGARAVLEIRTTVGVHLSARLYVLFQIYRRGCTTILKLPTSEIFGVERVRARVVHKQRNRAMQSVALDVATNLLFCDVLLLSCIEL